ncbi:MAG: chemotaxis protein CheW [Candidatus Thiodiazotropha sp.]
MSVQPDKPQKRDIRTRIEEPDDALKSYLDTLLSEIDVPSRSAPPKRRVRTRVEVQTETAAETKLQIPASSKLQARVEPVSMLKVKEPLADADIQVKEQTTTAPQATPEPNGAERQPEWADKPFQVLLFKVNGITMGIPLNALMGILSHTGQTKQLPGQPTWSLGVVLNREDKVVVIDTARLLMPERIDPEYLAAPKHLLLIGQGDRALAVDAICETRQIEKEQIRWRRGDQTRPWYAGIIIQELSVLLDVDGVLSLLAA